MKKTEIDGLLRRVANGDNVAFGELYEKTKRGVFAFLHTYLQNYADTEDAMQTVYLKVKQGIWSYKVGTNGRAWLLQIAKNHALNELKKRKDTLSLDGIEVVDRVHGYAEHGVMAVMDEVLSEEEKRIVTLHVLWKYKHREIAQILDCPTGTVTSKYKRAIEKLQKKLKEADV